jgi:putative flippase GtrA
VLQSLHREIIRLKGELAKFGVVGGIGAIIDLGGAAYLHDAKHVDEMAAKAISIAVATVVTYLGSRFWTFRHRVNQDQAIGRETAMFFLLNVVGLGIAELVIAITNYGFGLKGHLAYDAASVIGTGLGTIFRYFAYKKWVFTAEEPAPAAAGYYGPAEEHLEAAKAAE